MGHLRLTSILPFFNVSEDYDSFPWYKKAAYYVCGIEKQAQAVEEKEEDLTEEQLQEKLERERIEREKLVDISEKPKWRQITNINAIVLCTIAVFVCGFFY